MGWISDFLPGLVIDKFSDVLVVESLALGIDRYKEHLVELLKEILAADGVMMPRVPAMTAATTVTTSGPASLHVLFLFFTPNLQ